MEVLGSRQTVAVVINSGCGSSRLCSRFEGSGSRVGDRRGCADPVLWYAPGRLVHGPRAGGGIVYAVIADGVWRSGDSAKPGALVESCPLRGFRPRADAHSAFAGRRGADLLADAGLAGEGVHYSRTGAVGGGRVLSFPEPAGAGILDFDRSADNILLRDRRQDPRVLSQVLASVLYSRYSSGHARSSISSGAPVCRAARPPGVDRGGGRLPGFPVRGQLRARDLRAGVRFEAAACRRSAWRAAPGKSAPDIPYAVLQLSQ